MEIVIRVLPGDDFFLELWFDKRHATSAVLILKSMENQ
ncbi:hypothetical protein JOD69_002544 [Methylocaldum sp. RMAD-M]|jgi:hypothetical protein|nr:hypothetical protein [Methylocaldum sp. RMAD-M]